MTSFLLLYKFCKFLNRSSFASTNIPLNLWAEFISKLYEFDK